MLSIVGAATQIQPNAAISKSRVSKVLSAFLLSIRVAVFPSYFNLGRAVSTV